MKCVSPFIGSGPPIKFASHIPSDEDSDCGDVYLASSTSTAVTNDSYYSAQQWNEVSEHEQNHRSLISGDQKSIRNQGLSHQQNNKPATLSTSSPVPQTDPETLTTDVLARANKATSLNIKETLASISDSGVKIATYDSESQSSSGCFGKLSPRCTLRYSKVRTKVADIASVVPTNSMDVDNSQERLSNTLNPIEYSKVNDDKERADIWSTLNNSSTTNSVIESNTGNTTKVDPVTALTSLCVPDRFSPSASQDSASIVEVSKDLPDLSDDHQAFCKDTQRKTSPLSLDIRRRISSFSGFSRFPKLKQVKTTASLEDEGSKSLRKRQG